MKTQVGGSPWHCLCNLSYIACNCKWPTKKEKKEKEKKKERKEKKI